MNKVILIGRVATTPETRETKGDGKLTTLRMATKEFRGDDQFHNIKLFNKQAEFVEQYIKVGDLISIEGRINYREWTNDEGVTKYFTDILADRVEGLASKDRDEASKGKSSPKKKAAQKTRKPKVADDDAYDGIDEEAMPF